MVELISLHVPKCAGDALRIALQDIYGDGLFLDYERDKLLWPDSEFNVNFPAYLQRMQTASLTEVMPYRCIHGHFYIGKYDKFTNALRMTVLRDPVERVISHYLFLLWKNPAKQNPLQKQIKENNLNVLEFSRLPLIKYCYTRQFFRDIDMRMFDLIGDYGDMQGWVRRLGGLIGTPFHLTSSNDVSAKALAPLRQRILEDRPMLEQIRKELKDDIEFYEQYRVLSA